MHDAYGVSERSQRIAPLQANEFTLLAFCAHREHNAVLTRKYGLRVNEQDACDISFEFLGRKTTRYDGKPTSRLLEQ